MTTREKQFVSFLSPVKLIYFIFVVSYVVVENLRYMLSTYNSSEPIAFGHKFKPFVKQGYFSGGAGKLATD